ncbi:PufB [Staphylococcus phage Fi200W]|uniref:PufB n=7 Tax=Kayvirus G1 TaxID=292029 RepID=I6X664_9CAUD|nr:PufB cytochrome subunit [Staphylococcus phage 812]YP_009780165.1 hypothetical protein QLX23_gp104 [Staphylococcus phage ISP]YP_009780659.1 PufB [Staphylococcus phage Staph1N]YP_009781104.1 PufB [Staphylococcus phage 676Z]YP_009781337.1 PufB [Staphylococcus phage Fi200W]YP_009781570.1 PufB [Staphylococcus phage MSA6]YP_009781801.1 PufB [Staphylococcus phage P4W]YP_009782033.1 PufB [Staphylococcus phage A5W]ARM69019.1 hypothetical protein vBSauCG_102 [Staphylococcus phage vB_Sau_CG]AST157
MLTPQQKDSLKEQQKKLSKKKK